MGDRPWLSFSLDDDFINRWAKETPQWGFPCGAGNSIGELTFLRTYSRKDEKTGRKERWYETLRRVVEGTYSIQRDWCMANRLPWSDERAQESAQEMYERAFAMKFLPPGRGLEHMGTEFVWEEGSAAVNNCGWISTSRGLAEAAEWVTEALMLGIGVGFDAGAVGQKVYEPRHTQSGAWLIPDSREGWARSVGLLLKSHLSPNKPHIEFDYSAVRPAGTPIRRFGGVAAGPRPLQELHASIRRVFGGRSGSVVTSVDVADVMNLIGRCVIAGNVRKSAEIMLAGPEDPHFLDLKNLDVFPARNDWQTGWGWSSNNSVICEVGTTDYSEIARRAAVNGEPGVFWLDLAKGYGRLADPRNDRDHRITGTNPCGEQSLEDTELCCLVELFPTRCDSIEDFLRTVKFAFMYAKTVTLLPTHWPETNAIMQRNRRIGCSITGIAEFVDQRGLPELRRWIQAGYSEVQRWDRVYSEWLTVRESIKTTSVKPSGTVSLLAGVSPGVHWPVADTYIRRVRLARNSALLQELEAAGYHTEPALNDPDRTSIVELPVYGPACRTEAEVTIWEKAGLAAELQRWWADNQVSCTLTFDPETEGHQIERVLHAFEGQLKTASFLPISPGVYAQVPYERVSEDEVARRQTKVRPVDFEALYGGEGLVDAEGDKYCNTDSCEMKATGV